MKFDDQMTFFHSIRYAKRQLPRLRDWKDDLILVEVFADIGKVDMVFNIPFKKRYSKDGKFPICWELDVSKSTMDYIYKSCSPDVQSKGINREDNSTSELSHDTMWNNRGYKFEN